MDRDKTTHASQLLWFDPKSKGKVEVSSETAQQMKRDKSNP
jgi:hypothetical protein